MEPTPDRYNVEFISVREAYLCARLAERQRIVNFLDDSGFKLLNRRRGCGKGVYTNSNTLNPPHDLRNWLWIDAVRPDGREIRVMLQSFDRDSTSKNEHVLFDRLSIGLKPSHIVDSRWFTVTDFELPLPNESLADLVNQLEELR